LTIRVYEPTHPPLRMSDLAKRKRVVLERKAVDKILIDEDQGIVFMYKDGNEEPEAFKHSGYRLEILEGDPNDGITDGLTLKY